MLFRFWKRLPGLSNLCNFESSFLCLFCKNFILHPTISTKLKWAVIRFSNTYFHIVRSSQGRFKRYFEHCTENLFRLHHKVFFPWCMVCRLYVPTDISSFIFASFRFSWSISKNFTFTLSPSVDTWRKRFISGRPSLSISKLTFIVRSLVCKSQRTIWHLKMLSKLLTSSKDF